MPNFDDEALFDRDHMVGGRASEQGRLRNERARVPSNINGQHRKEGYFCLPERKSS